MYVKAVCTNVLTVSPSAASDIRREALLFLRYDKRLPLAMKGITMVGV